MSKYHTFWRRLGATFLDTFALTPLSWLNLLLWQYVASPPVLAGWVVLQLLLHSSYSILMHGLYGQTLGKMVCRITVLDVSGEPLSLRQAVLRDLLPLVTSVYFCSKEIHNIFNGRFSPFDFSQDDFLIMATVYGFWLTVELATMLTNEKRRSLHDFIAGSVVVRLPWSEENNQYIVDNNPYRKRIFAVLIVIMLLDTVVSSLPRHNSPQKLPDNNPSESTPRSGE